MPSELNLRIRHWLGVLMIVLGAAVLVRIYVLGHPPRLGSQFVDTIFGAFFLLRGALNLKTLVRPRA
jgi:hypothetical protein